MRNLFLLVLFSSFQLPFVGGLEILGVSFNSLKDIVLYGVFLVAFLLAKGSGLRGGWEISLYLLFLFFLLFSLSVSPDLITGFQYFLKISFPFLAYLVFSSISFRPVFGLFRLVVCAILTFVIFSIVVGYLLGDPQSGITDRHFLKFSVLFLMLLSVSMMTIRYKLYIAILLFLCSSFSLLVIMQRGAFLSFFIGSFVIMYVTGWLSWKRLIISGGGALVFVLALFSSDSFIDYAFYDGIGPDYILSEISNGNFDSSFIRDRERGVLLEAMLEGYELSVLPEGLGEAKERISSLPIFFSGKEPHNDIVVLLIDLGVIGFLSFIFFYLLILRRAANEIVRSELVISMGMRALMIASLGFLVGVLVWMSFSNVLIYASTSLLLPFSLLGILRRRNSL